MTDAADRLLPWYDLNARVLPWRAVPGTRAQPYHVWLSEIMLQQTTVTAAAPYFLAFRARWPDVTALAAAPLDDVLSAWAGLGYYARARNLHACARHVAEQLGGRFPETEAGLLELPGIGPYTAAAIAAIAFDRPATVVDGNVERVVARLFDIATPMPAAKPALRSAAAELTPVRRPGDFAQAMMDLGATVCVPRRPSCPACPLVDLCRARRAGTAEDRPVRAAKSERPTRFGTAFWLVNPAGDVLLRRRPLRGLLGGMVEVPTTPWEVKRPPAAPHAPLPVAWMELPGQVRHTFSHFHLELDIVAAGAGHGWEAAQGFWVPPAAFAGLALPSVMRKVVRQAEAWQNRRNG